MKSPKTYFGHFLAISIISVILFIGYNPPRKRVQQKYGANFSFNFMNFIEPF